jgi:hypothetical protein
MGERLRFGGAEARVRLHIVAVLAVGVLAVGVAAGACTGMTPSHGTAGAGGRPPSSVRQGGQSQPSGRSPVGSMRSMRSSFEDEVVSGTRTLYVDAVGGSDANSGMSTSTALATIQRAVDMAEPGDRILVAAGTYGALSVYGYLGDARHWLSIQSVSDRERPVIHVAAASGVDGIDIQQSSFVGIYGFEVEGLQSTTEPNPSGIAVFGSGSV